MKDFGEKGKNLENSIFIIFINEIGEFIKKENYDNDIKL